MEWLLDHVSFEGEECLIWPFNKQNGYAGCISADGRRQYACRVMCKLAHGPAPTPKHEVAHSCGKGDEACINPKHLRWATSAENGADRKLHTLQRKALQPKEERHQEATLADDILRGATPIGIFLFGADDPNAGRKVYGMPDAERKALGLFNMGKTVSA